VVEGRKPNQNRQLMKKPEPDENQDAQRTADFVVSTKVDVMTCIG